MSARPVQITKQLVAKCRLMAGPREFGSIGQNRLRTGSVERFERDRLAPRIAEIEISE